MGLSFVVFLPGGSGVLGTSSSHENQYWFVTVLPHPRLHRHPDVHLVRFHVFDPRHQARSLL
jgi:hypothetical protein